MSDDKIELKIVKDAEGNDVELTNMSIKESRSLIILLEALTNIIELSSNSKNIRLQVVKGSASVVAQGPPKEMSFIQNGFTEIIESKSSNHDLVDNWRKIQNLIISNGLEYQANFYNGGFKKPVIDQIKNSRPFRTKSKRVAPVYKLTFIEGQLIEVGGKVPNIHLINKKHEKLTISCSESEARRVNSFLYKDIKISVWKKVTSVPNFIFCDHYINDNTYNDFKAFNNGKLEYDDFLQSLHYKIKSFIDKDDFGTLNKFLKLFKHSSIESSTLKTILVITKAFRDNENIKLSRNEIKELIETKRGLKLI